MMPVENRVVVCHLRDSNFFGGPEKQILEHCGLLAAGSRFKPLLGYFHGAGQSSDLASRAQAAGVGTLEIESRGAFDLTAIPRLRRGLIEANVALLVTHGYKADVLGAAACRGISTKFLPCARGFTGETAKIRFYETLQRWVLRRSPYVAAVSTGTAGVLEALGVERSRVLVVENAIRAKVTVPSVDLRAELGLPPGARTTVSVGRLSVEKGHAVLVRAFGALDARDRGYLLLIGDGPERDRLGALAEELGVSPEVRFLGFRSDVLGCLRDSDLFVLPSYTEGLPNAVLEAFVAQIPVVATRVGGTPELVKHGRTGLLTAKGSVDELRDALRYAAEHAANMKRMARAARKFVGTWFTFERQQKRWEEVYETVLSAGERRGPA
jgi:glycosyltransferase involved in cell wall biosynthesis